MPPHPSASGPAQTLPKAFVLANSLFPGSGDDGVPLHLPGGVRAAAPFLGFRVGRVHPDVGYF